MAARAAGRQGHPVGLFFANGAEWVTWWLAVSRIGAVAVPLSTMYRPAEIAKVIRLADVGLLVAPTRVLDIDVAERLEAALPRVERPPQSATATGRGAPFLRAIVLTDGADRAMGDPAGASADSVSPEVQAAAEAEVSPADLAIMVHTSGSTADPKGVLHTHGTLIRQTSTWPAAIRSVTGSPADPVILCAMPFFWIGGVLAATGALHEPITLLVMPQTRRRARHSTSSERERATGLVGWPAFTQRIREHPSFADRDLTSAPCCATVRSTSR